MVILLLASYFFYMSWNPVYGLLLLFCTLSTYIGGRLLAISAEKGPSNRLKWILAICIITNILFLLYFKYFNFVIENLNRINYLFGYDCVYERLDIILPVGISFYMFQAISYVIDVYRDNTAVERNFLRYALYISFFPQLVAGPIERSGAMLSQINRISEIRLWDYSRIIAGLKIMLYGFFLKMVVADRLAVYVDEVFGNYRKYNSTILIIAVIFFGIQIYCDFCSYSLIAVGSAKVMGFSLMENFDAPYLSRSVTEFWRRWHISLNTWFRDYVYIPLGGNRCSALRNVANIMIVFALSGLWHGASWTFVVWGAINGLFHIAEKYLKPLLDKLNHSIGTKTESFSYKAAKTVYAFAVVDFAWIFFRSPSMTDAIGFIKRIFTRWDPWLLFNNGILSCIPEGFSGMEMRIAMTGIAVMVIMDILKYVQRKGPDTVLEHQCIWFRWTAYILLFVIIIVFGVYGEGFQSMDFIYFQF